MMMNISLHKTDGPTVKNLVEQGQTEDKIKQRKSSEHLPTTSLGGEATW